MSDRLVLEVTSEQRRQIKTLAAFSGMTMKSFILSRTLDAAQPPAPKATRSKAAKKGDDTDFILASPAMGRRLEAAMSEPRNRRRAFKNIEEVRHALGIRR